MGKQYKIVALIILLHFCLLSSCSNKQTKVELKEQVGTIAQLTFSISGKISGKAIPYIFYQVEDGHGTLSEGKIVTDKNRSFIADIKITSPSNGYGQIYFYYDPTQSDALNVESVTLLKIGAADLVFDPSIVYRGNDNEIANNELWQTAAYWRESGLNFRTDSVEPLILYREDRLEDGMLYVENQKLVYARFSSEGTVRQELIQFANPLSLRVWRNGNVLLMGGKDESNNSGRIGRWYGVQLPNLDDRTNSLAQAEELEAIFFGGNEVLTMVYVEEPRLFFLTVPNGSRFTEFVYQHGSGNMLWINNTYEDEMNPEAAEQYRERTPEKQEQPLSFAKHTSFPFNHEGTLHAFEDERGTIVYYKTETQNHVWRYVDSQVIDFRLFHDEFGLSYPLGKFVVPSGQSKLTMLNWGSHSYFNGHEMLWEDGWNMISPMTFYRLTPERLETIHNYYSFEMKDYASVYKTFPLNGVQYIGQISGSVFLFEVDGMKRQLSLYDAIYFRQRADHQNENSLDELWIDNSVAVTSQIVDVAGLQPEQIAESWERQIEAALPASLFEYRASWHSDDDGPEALNKLKGALDHECLSGCGDYSSEIIYREFTGEWYALVRQSLYALRNEQLIKLAELPVQTAPTFMYGKGGSTYTAQDFVQAGSDWFIADTFGNRVLKLDSSWNLTAEYALPYPEQITVMDNDQLLVSNLQGDTVLDKQLRLIGNNKRSFTAVPKEDISHISLRPSHLYEDHDRGIIWAYSYSQYRLIQYRPIEGSVRSKYVGGLFNNAAEAKIIPFRNNVIVLFDNRALLFTLDGQWMDTFEFPRDPNFDDLVNGEGTIYADEKRGLIYLVQGYRILQIDPAAGQVHVLFEQHNTDIGNIVYDDEKLYFTLRHGYWYSPLDSYNELVVYDLNTNHPRRWNLESGFISNHIENRAIVLWKYDPDGNGKKVWAQVLLESVK